MSIDLHFHSVYSEGALTIDELLGQLTRYTITTCALTDHNTIAGVPEFLEKAAKKNMTALAGVELYTVHNGQPLHLLGYHFDLENKFLQKAIHKLQADNRHKTEHAIQALQQNGFVMDAESVFQLPSHNYGIIHLLQEMERHPENVKKIEADLPPRQRSFFDKITHYFNPGTIGYLPLSELPTAEAITLIKEAGGFTSLAHPGQQLTFEQTPLIDELISAGLDALEALSPYHNWHQIEHYQGYALEHQLAMTGGSDYHSDINFSKKELIARQWDYLAIPSSFYQQLKNKFNLP